MAVFPILKFDPIVQVGDQIRFDASQSFMSGENDDVTKVEITVGTDDSVDVFNPDQSEWFFDYLFTSIDEGAVPLLLSITTGVAPDEVVRSQAAVVVVVSKANDYLFSTDEDLKTLEHDILKWIPAGYSSWNHVHRQAQLNIVDWLDDIRLFKDDGSSFKKTDLVNRSQVRRLSMFTTLRMIFGSLSNQNDDIFYRKMRDYLTMETAARNKNYLSLDVGSDSANPKVVKNSELRSTTLVRR